MRGRLFLVAVFVTLLSLAPCWAADPAIKVANTANGLCLVPDVPTGTLASLYAVPIGRGQWAVIGAVVEDGKIKHWAVSMLISAQPIPPDPGPGPGPGPGPDPTPPPADSAEEISYQTAVKLKLPPSQAAVLAKVYDEIALQVGKSIATTDQLVTATKFARTLALGSAALAWDPWAQAVGQWLDEKRAAGVLTTIDQFKTAWGQIAAGLRRVK